jgi:hypothetical protein
VIVKGRTAMQTQTERRFIGLDVHREFAQVAIWQGGLVMPAGRFATTPEARGRQSRSSVAVTCGSLDTPGSW